jgi:hypothetical protein
MSTSETKNLPDPLEETEAAYRDPVTQLPPVGEEMLARRADRFASSVHFGLHESAAMRRLHKLTKDLRTIPRLDSLLPTVLTGALSLMKADFGNIQIVDPATGALKIVTQAGFGPEFLEYFAVVDDGDGSACARAATQCAQTVVTDVRSDPDFAPHREIAASSGFRGVQSTPLVDYTGHLIGMISTHFRRPRRPSDRELRIMELYSDLAGDAVTRRLGISPQHDPGDPVGRAVISALLNGGYPRHASVSVPFELWVMGQMTAVFTRRDGRTHPDNNGQGS